MDSYQGMPSDPALSEVEGRAAAAQIGLQPLVEQWQGQRLKPLTSCAMGGIAEAMP